MAQNAAPETLLEAVQYFADKDVALQFVVALRWPNGVICPRCESREWSFLSTRRLWKCKACKKQFSVKVGTIFEDSPIGLEKWLPAMWMIANCKNGISSYELGRALGVTQKTAWFMLHRIRLAMQSESFDKFKGEVEVDETYIGGKLANMHKKRRPKNAGRGSWAGKVAVMGLLERHGPDRSHSVVRTRIIRTAKRKELFGVMKEEIEPKTEVFTDALPTYASMNHVFVHQFIDHSEKYVKGKVHTNGLENFWSLLKRALKGTYVAVEPFHLFRYLDEQVFRFNKRKGTDSSRFTQAVASVVGKRITYKALTANEAEAAI